MGSERLADIRRPHRQEHGPESAEFACIPNHLLRLDSGIHGIK
jgi:hypothetical protein